MQSSVTVVRIFHARYDIIKQFCRSECHYAAAKSAAGHAYPAMGAQYLAYLSHEKIYRGHRDLKQVLHGQVAGGHELAQLFNIIILQRSRRQQSTFVFLQHV